MCVAAHVAHVAIDTSEGQGIYQKNLVKPQVSSGIISRIGDDYSPGKIITSPYLGIISRL